MSDSDVMELADLNDLLDGDWDTLPDSGFETWPSGSFHATCSMVIKEVAEHPTVEVSYKLIEVIELANPDAVAPAIGAINNELCFLDNQMGLANLKKHLKTFGQHFGITNRRQIIDAVKDVEVQVVNKVRWDKKAEVWRFNVEEQMVL